MSRASWSLVPVVMIGLATAAGADTIPEICYNPDTTMIRIDMPNGDRMTATLTRYKDEAKCKEWCVRGGMVLSQEGVLTRGFVMGEFLGGSFWLEVDWQLRDDVSTIRGRLVEGAGEGTYYANFYEHRSDWTGRTVEGCAKWPEGSSPLRKLPADTAKAHKNRVPSPMVKAPQRPVEQLYAPQKRKRPSNAETAGAINTLRSSSGFDTVKGNPAVGRLTGDGMMGGAGYRSPDPGRGGRSGAAAVGGNRGASSAQGSSGASGVRTSVRPGSESSGTVRMMVPSGADAAKPTCSLQSCPR
jgi:hypothetical protein